MACADSDPLRLHITSVPFPAMTPRVKKTPRYSVQAELPFGGEDIYVCFQLTDGKTVWWPATVEEWTVNPTDPDVLADAVIVYHAAFHHKAESADVQVLLDRTVRTTVTSYVDASWRFTGEQFTPEKPDDVSRTRQCASSQPSDDGVGDPDGADAEVGDRVSAAATASTPKTPAQAQKSKKRNMDKEDHGERQKWTSLAPNLTAIHERLLTLESASARNKKCDHADLVESRVRATRMIMMDTILRNASNLPRPRPADNNEKHMHVLATGCVEHTFHMDYDLFKYILTDIELTMRPYGSVLVKPYGDEIVGRTARVSRHVIFRTAKSFFDWLGITEDMNRMAVLVEDRDQHGTGGVQAMRVMGALRSNTEDANAMVQILIGRSGSGVSTGRCEAQDPAIDAMEEHPTCGDAHVECLAYANSHWDEDCNDFTESIVAVTGHTGPLTEEHIRSTFSISWQALKPLSKGKYSLTPTFAEGVQLGTVTVRYPYVLLRGRQACGQARLALNELRLHTLV